MLARRKPRPNGVYEATAEQIMCSNSSRTIYDQDRRSEAAEWAHKSDPWSVVDRTDRHPRRHFTVRLKQKAYLKSVIYGARLEIIITAVASGYKKMLYHTHTQPGQ